MKKVFCDKCGEEIWKLYTIKCEGFDDEKEDPYNNRAEGFIYLKRYDGYTSELHFCGECINELSKITKKWLNK